MKLCTSDTGDSHGRHAAAGAGEDERLGYHSVWTAEAYGSDAMVRSRGWRSRPRIRLGTAIFQMAART